MCANFRPTSREWLRQKLGTDVPFEFREEAYPGYDAPIVVSDGKALVPLRAKFGLIPHWAKSDRIARSTYNARSETASSKPSFRNAWRKRQLCLVPVKSFYEPCYESGKAVRYRIRRRDDEPFMLAAIWESRRLDDGSRFQHSFSLLTMTAGDHPIMRRMHSPNDEKRSIVVINDCEESEWLKASSDDDLRGAMKLFPAEMFLSEPAPR